MLKGHYNSRLNIRDTPIAFWFLRAITHGQIHTKFAKDQICSFQRQLGIPLEKCEKHSMCWDQCLSLIIPCKYKQCDPSKETLHFSENDHLSGNKGRSLFKLRIYSLLPFLLTSRYNRASQTPHSSLTVSWDHNSPLPSPAAITHKDPTKGCHDSWAKRALMCHPGELFKSENIPENISEIEGPHKLWPCNSEFSASYEIYVFLRGVDMSGGAAQRSICRLGLAGAALACSVGCCSSAFPKNLHCARGEEVKPPKYCKSSFVNHSNNFCAIAET